jgi:hypothetical protein
VTRRLTNYPAPPVVIRHRPAGVAIMRRYFIRDRRVVGVEMLPPGLAEQDAVARAAHTLASKRRGRIDGFEVSDGARLVIRHSALSAASIV